MQSYTNQNSPLFIADRFEELTDDDIRPGDEPIDKGPTQPTGEVITITMQPDNVAKILSGEKTTTLRTNNLASGVYNIGGQLFNLTNRGLLNVKEAGGVDTISKSEAFAETGPKFSSTKDFLAGKRKLYVIDISPATQPGAQAEMVKQKVYRTLDTFSSKVDYAQRGSGAYYALDKPFQEVGSENKVGELTVSYDPSKTLDATTKKGQDKFMQIKRSAIEGKTFTSIKESNDAVRDAMLANGYDSLIGFIDQNVKDAGRELVIYKSTQPAANYIQIDMFKNQNTLINKNGGTIEAANKSCS